jgi:ribonuclease P protein component
MFAAARESTASVSACARAPGGPSSGGAARKSGAASLRNRPASLRRSADFARVRRTGTEHRAGGVKVFVAQGESSAARVGLVAGRNVGGAVRRNRAKRRLREALARVTLRDGHDYVVVASPAVVTTPFRELVVWLQRCMEP